MFLYILLYSIWVRWSPEGPISQIQSPHLHAGAPGIFSDLLRSVQMLQREWGAESNGKLPSLVKLQPGFLSLRLKTYLWAELRPWYLSLQWRSYHWTEYSSSCSSSDDNDDDTGSLAVFLSLWRRDCNRMDSGENDDTWWYRIPLFIIMQGITPLLSQNSCAASNEILEHPPYSPDMSPCDYDGVIRLDLKFNIL